MGFKLHNKIKVLSLIYTSFLLISTTSYAEVLVEPEVKLDKAFWMSVNFPRTDSNSTPSGAVLSYRFEYHINEQLAEIEKINNDSRLFILNSEKYTKTKIIKNRKIKTYSSMHGSEKLGMYKDKGIYVFDNNDICIGYVSVIKGKTLSHLQNNPKILKMKALKKSTKYLKEDLLVPRTQIDFYEKDHGDYIERFGINKDFIFLDAFYPKDLDEYMSKKIVEVLNFNYISSKEANKHNMSEHEFEEKLKKEKDKDD